MAGTDGVRRLNRRALLRGVLGIAAAAAGGAVLAACGGSATPTSAPAASTAKPTTAAPTTGAATSSAANATQPTGSAPSGATGTTPATTSAGGAVDGKIPSPAPELGVPDAYTKYPPTYKSVPATPGKGGRWTAFITSYEPPPTPKGENKWWQDLEKRLGVVYEPTIAPAADYPAKWATTIASGDLPDTMFCDPVGNPDQYKVLLQGAFADLTPYLSGDGLKEFPNLAKFPSVLWKNVSLNKKIYGVPHPRFIGNNSFYFRQDWAEKAGFATQKNADDVLNMFVFWTKNDPDGNGKADTWAISSSSPRPQLGLDILQQMFRVPNGWRLNPDGSLLRRFETDEYKQVLAYMKKLWDAGVIHPDALTNSTNQNKDLFFSSHVGAYSDGLSGLLGSGGARGKTQQLTPTAKVTGWVPVGFDGGKATYHKAIGYFGFTAISAKAGKDKERVKELLRIQDWMAAPFGSEEYTFHRFGIEGLHYDLKSGLPTLNDKGRADIGPLGRFTEASPVAFFDLPGDSEYMQTFQNNLMQIGIDDPTWGYYSPTNGPKAGELEQLEADMRIAVVTGREPISTLDAFIKDWKQRGGDQIRKEFEQSIKDSK